jgi:CRISPR system Cascade subunit CasA
MNLLTNQWIPVTHNGQFKQITLEDVLCQEVSWQLHFHRDDMALATLQLIVSLVQIIFMPNDVQALRQCFKKPLSRDEYQIAIQQYLDMFVLNHSQHPFMQTVKVKGKGVSPQKLFIGLPEKTSSSASAHAFFNQPTEIKEICLSCATIAVFQQATNGLSLGGVAFSVGLKGSAPITTLLLEMDKKTKQRDLRKTIWLNILHKEFIKESLADTPLSGNENLPTWIEPIAIGKEKVTIYANKIGLLRGLFWQPARMKLDIDTVDTKKQCDSCGIVTHEICTGFMQEPYTYKRGSTWIHPHSPMYLKDKDFQYLKFSSKKPMWEQFTGFFGKKDNKSDIPALVVTQMKKVFPRKPIVLAAGGYILGDSTEKIEGRRHELFQFEEGWEGGLADMNTILEEVVLKIPDSLGTAIYAFWKTVHKDKEDKNHKKKYQKLVKHVKDEFFRRSESEIHQHLEDVDWNEIDALKQTLFDYLSRLARDLYDEVTKLYEYNPAMLNAVEIGKGKLNYGLTVANPRKKEDG